MMLHKKTEIMIIPAARLLTLTRITPQAEKNKHKEYMIATVIRGESPKAPIFKAK
jgi:hypothetical protein